MFDELENETLLIETGYHKPLALLSIEDRDDIISAVTDYYCQIKAKAATDQFMEGLDAGVLQCIKKYPDKMKPLFCPEPFDLSAGKL